MIRYKMWYLLPSKNIFKIETISLSLDRFLNMIQTEEYIACSTNNHLFLNKEYQWQGIDAEKEIVQEIKRIENEISHRNILS
jgi:mevalonate pyrophosphate decarboxylase